MAGFYVCVCSAAHPCTLLPMHAHPLCCIMPPLRMCVWLRPFITVCICMYAGMVTDKKVLQLLASALEVQLADSDEVDPFALLEAALTKLGIKFILPHSAQHVNITELSDELSRGDHIVVRSAGSNEVFHHGIYIGPYTPPGGRGETKPRKYVVDMFGETHEGSAGASLRLRTMEEFLRTRGFPELAVIRYSEDTQAARDRSADLALSTQQLHDCKGLYHLLGFNCNHFATWCRTLRWVTAEVTAAGAQAHAATCRLQPLKLPSPKAFLV
jgi:hypothetical protein